MAGGGANADGGRAARVSCSARPPSELVTSVFFCEHVLWRRAEVCSLLRALIYKFCDVSFSYFGIRDFGDVRSTRGSGPARLVCRVGAGAHRFWGEGDPGGGSST